MNLVFDSSALIALVEGEEGHVVVGELMNDPDNDCYAHAVNLCEVYYDFLRSDGQATAEAIIADLDAAGLVGRDDMDRDFWRKAGTHKAEFRRISLADCFCATLANRIDAEVVTTDHHEFDALAESGKCRVRFIR